MLNILDIIKDWIKEILRECIMGNLDGMFDQINNEDKVTFVKLDVEGAETDAIAGGNKAFSSAQDMQVVACTYHRTEDADELYAYFHDKGFETGFSKGYLFVGGLETVKAELRKGVLTARKGERFYGQSGS